ncbi:MAG: hypothetical protein Q4Q53_03635 [Methanocorpusculum sp.]|nr:hypothetical protein [Methanocorpusculum sp.]
MKKSDIIISLAGIILGAILLILSRSVFADEKAISGFCLGFGAAIFVLGFGNLIGKLVTAKVETPEIARIKNIEENDERNIRVKEKAGWATARIMNIVLCVLALASALTNQELYITLILAVLVVVYGVLILGFNIYYEKRL